MRIKGKKCGIRSCRAAAVLITAVAMTAFFGPLAFRGDVLAEEAVFGGPSEGEPSVWGPAGICGKADGGLLVTDVFQKTVWEIQDGKRSLYAGRSGISGLYGEPEGGCRDGSRMELQMRQPWEIVPYLDGYAVSDTKNNMIRYITASQGRTAAGTGKEGYEDGRGGRALFYKPTGLAVDPAGNLYIADTGNDVIRVLTPSGQVDTYVRGLSGPTGLCYYDGALYVADTGNHRIVKVVDKTVTPVAGSGAEGNDDGAAETARFSSPQRITAAEDGTLYVSDSGNGSVRRISQGRVETLPADESMTEPAGLYVSGQSLYVCDSFSRKIHILSR